MLQFKVPQNIDLEDKIFGPLTLMQFIYLMAGGMIIYAAYELASTAVFWIISIPVAMLTLSLAFVKIQDQPFSKFLTSAAFFFVNPKKRRWQKNPKDEKFIQETFPQKIQKKEKKIEVKKVEKSELEKLAGILDTSSIDKIAKHQNIKISAIEKKETKEDKKSKNQNITSQKKEEVADIFK